MRTLDEVVKAVEEDLERANVSYPEVFYDYDNHKDALHYLKEYQRYQNTPSRNGHMALVDYFDEQQKNEPLTWDELRTMEGKPVFVEQCNGDTKGWLLILRTNYDVINCTTKHGNSFYLYKSSYGEKWQAYRKERKNETD